MSQLVKQAVQEVNAFVEQHGGQWSLIDLEIRSRICALLCLARDTQSTGLWDYASALNLAYQEMKPRASGQR